MTSTKWSKSLIFSLLWEVQEGKCFYCKSILAKETFDRKNQKDGWTRDHFLPRSAGHFHLYNNVLACGYCNESKAAEAPTEAECAAFSVMYDKINARHAEIYPKAQKHMALGEVWSEYLECRNFIKAFSRLFGLPCPFQANTVG